MAPNSRQTIFWINAGSIHWRIYAELEGDESNRRWSSGMDERLHPTVLYYVFFFILSVIVMLIWQKSIDRAHPLCHNMTLCIY